MNGSKLPLLLLLSLIAGLVLFASQPLVPVAGAVVYHNVDDNNFQPPILVDNDRVQCPNAQFTSIQAAVTAASPGTEIRVCPGTYPETVRIPKSLTVRGIRVGNENLVLINPPLAAANTSSINTGSPIAAIVLVERAATVTLDNLTVDGAANLINACAPNLIGIFYRNASGKIQNVAVKNIRLFPDALLGCQSGLGIFAQSGNEPGVLRGARVEVTNCSIHDYQKNGITANESGTELIATGNAVTGLGPTPAIAQNGIQIGFRARGRIERNSVINHVYSLCTTPMTCHFPASNILVFSSVSGINVLGNHLGKSQVNLTFAGDGSGLITNGLIEGNTVFDSDVFDGIAIENGNNNTVRNNSIYNSGEAAVFVDGDLNQIVGNNFNEARFGVLLDPVSARNTISGNQYFNIARRVVPPSAAASSAFQADALSTPTPRTVSPIRP